MTTTTTLARDAHGLTMTADASTVDLYDQAIDRLARYHPDVIDLATQLGTQAAPAPMANALIAYLHLMSTDPTDLATVRAVSQALDGAEKNDREQLHATAVSAWLGGDWVGAARVLDELLVRYPTDLLALMFGHQLDFFVGDAHNLRDRPLRSLAEFDPAHPHAGFVRGMASFGLEEAGHYEQARAMGLAALDANADDVWAVHAVVHTYEMQGMVDSGIRFLREREADWGRGNLFTVHNWWHLAIYHLEAGQADRSLAIYDAEIHHADSAGVAMEMLDASALLWRLFLDGDDTGGRFAALADAWSPKAADDPWYAFNDVHAAMALAGAGRLDDARRLVQRLESWLASAPAGERTNVMMTADIGLPASRAVLAFAEGRHDDVLAELLPVRRRLHRFGGSHAQRDALQRTILESALRAGRFELARSLTAERLGTRDTSVYGWMQRARALRGLSRTEEATAADARAAGHRERFARA
jgi:tetratricopeptide (TPR) repeat protein